MTVPSVMSLVVVLVMMGFAGSAQVSSARASLERVHARRVTELAAASAFEEACAALEAALPGQPPLPPGQSRDLGTAVAWPARVEPAVTRADLAAHGVEVSAVSVTTGPWDVSHDTTDVDPVVREVGLVDLEVTVTMRVGRARLARRFAVRRYAGAHADEETGLVHVWVLPNNVQMEVTAL